MSFSKTISVVAALASIFSVGVASWKISEEIKKDQTTPLEQKITELEKELKETKEQTVTVAPVVPVLPQPVQVKQAAPAIPQLPPLPVPPQSESQQQTP